MIDITQIRSTTFE